MDVWTWALVVGVGWWALKRYEERRRMALLGSHLQPYRIEKLMEQLTQGYARALGEDDAERRQAIWTVLDGPAQELAQQFERFTADMARLPAEQVRVCRWAWPWIDRWWPASTIDLRALFQVHAQGLQAMVANGEQRSPKARAHMLLAEMLLMQHTCHWFCKSRTVASARLLARHKTAYHQVLEAVSPATRQAYERLLQS